MTRDSKRMNYPEGFVFLKVQRSQAKEDAANAGQKHLLLYYYKLSEGAANRRPFRSGAGQSAASANVECNTVRTVKSNKIKKMGS